jgi:recombination protein RecT
MSNTNITTKPQGLKSLINSEAMRQQFALALPKHLTAERFTRIAITALTRTPKLQECTPESFMRCLLDLSALGIEPDGRRAHLIPYGKECSLILDYKGIAELVMRSGAVSSIHADKVCDNDVFDVDRGKITTHRIDYKTPRGKSYAYYVIVTFKDGSEKCEVMTRDEVDGIRKRSKAGNSGPWVSDFDEMGKKTVFRRASKWLPLSPEIRDAMEKDGDALDDSPRIATGRVVEGTQAKLANPYEDAPAAFEDLPGRQLLQHMPDMDPQPTGEAPLASPVEVSEQTERAQLIDEIKDTCAENELTMATFGGKAKSLDFMAAKDTMRDMPIDALREIHANRLAIVKGEYKAGGAA